MFRFVLINIFILGSLSVAQAKVFRNSYISFQLPPNWDCHLDEMEWVCYSSFSQKAKEAIIILTAKEQGPPDTLSAYEAFLKQSRRPMLRGGRPGPPSKVKKVTRTRINGQVWIDALHLGSEVPHYYTRYLATVKNGLGILVTFSAYERYFSKYASDFMRAIRSLRVIAPKDLLGRSSSHYIRGPREQLGSSIGRHLPGLTLPPSDLPEEPDLGAKKKSLYTKLIGLGLVLLAVVLFLLKKKKG